MTKLAAHEGCRPVQNPLVLGSEFNSIGQLSSTLISGLAKTVTGGGLKPHPSVTNTRSARGRRSEQRLKIVHVNMQPKPRSTMQ